MTLQPRIRLSPTAFAFAILWMFGCRGDCTGSRSARAGYIDSQRDGFVYRGDPRAAYQEAAALLKDNGYLLASHSQIVGRTLPTNWKARAYGDARYELRINQTNGGRFTVRLHWVTRDREGVTTDRVRAKDLEWELIQRAEPARSMDILETARKREEKTYEARGCR